MLTVVLHAVLCLLPAVALAIPLLARRYPGERALLTLGSSESARWPRARSRVAPRRRVVPLAVRGGRLMGSSLAVRPPPVPVLAS